MNSDTKVEKITEENEATESTASEETAVRSETADNQAASDSQSAKNADTSSGDSRDGQNETSSIKSKVSPDEDNSGAVSEDTESEATISAAEDEVPDDLESGDSDDKEAKSNDRRSSRRSQRGSSRSDKSSSRDRKSSRTEDEADLEEDDEDEGLDNLDDLTGIDDPLAPAFDLDRGAPLKPYEDSIPWQQSKVSSAKEFFNTEILYRFDIIDPDDIEPLKGKYRIELKGDNGGVWSFSIENQIDITNTREEADTILKMHERDFLAIVNGKLNPQLAILAQKIKVSGEVKKAIKLQEILAPNPE